MGCAHIASRDPTASLSSNIDRDMEIKLLLKEHLGP